MRNSNLETDELSDLLVRNYNNVLDPLVGNYNSHGSKLYRINVGIHLSNSPLLPSPSPSSNLIIM